MPSALITATACCWVLGISMVYCLNCDEVDRRPIFDDLASKTVLASAIFVGKPVQMSASNNTSDQLLQKYGGIWHAQFEMTLQLRGLDQLEFAEKVIVGGLIVDQNNCTTEPDLESGKSYYVFLNGSTSTSMNRSVFWTSGSPQEVTKLSQKKIQKFVCPNCGKSEWKIQSNNVYIG